MYLLESIKLEVSHMPHFGTRFSLEPGQVRTEQGRFLGHNYIDDMRGKPFALGYEQPSQGVNSSRTWTVQDSKDLVPML